MKKPELSIAIPQADQVAAAVTPIPGMQGVSNYHARTWPRTPPTPMPLFMCCPVWAYPTPATPRPNQDNTDYFGYLADDPGSPSSTMSIINGHSGKTPLKVSPLTPGMVARGEIPRSAPIPIPERVVERSPLQTRSLTDSHSPPLRELLAKNVWAR